MLVRERGALAQRPLGRAADAACTWQARVRGAAADPAPGEQHQVKPRDIADQALVARLEERIAAQLAGELVKPEQSGGAGLRQCCEPHARTGLRFAEARRDAEPVGEFGTKHQRGVAPGHEVGRDQQRRRRRDDRDVPEQAVQQRLLRRHEHQLRHSRLGRVADHARLLQRARQHVVAAGRAVDDPEAERVQHRPERQGLRQEAREKRHQRHQRDAQRRLRQADHEQHHRGQRPQHDGDAA